MTGSRIVVFHGGYGCDTGCCGHYIVLDDDETKFVFDHPDATQALVFNPEVPQNLSDDHKHWVENVVTAEFGAEHVADINWDEVEVVIY